MSEKPVTQHEDDGSLDSKIDDAANDIDTLQCDIRALGQLLDEIGLIGPDDRDFGDLANALDSLEASCERMDSRRSPARHCPDLQAAIRDERRV